MTAVAQCTQISKDVKNKILIAIVIAILEVFTRRNSGSISH